MRTLSAAVYAAICILGLLLSEFTAIALFSFFIVLMTYEFLKTFASESSKISKIFSYSAALSLAVFGFILAKSNATWQLMFIPVLIFVSIPAVFMLADKKFTPKTVGALLMPAIYFGLPFWFALDMSFTPQETSYAVYSAYPVLYVFVLLWIYDSMAYFVGIGFGKHRLYEAISPKKSIEGFVGGIVLTVLLSVIASLIFDFISLRDAIVLAIIAGIFGTLGDLIASWLKRSVDLKDFGNIMPGHGGMIDRLDSILYVLPWVWAYYQII